MKYSVTGYPLTLEGARNACNGFGKSWSFHTETSTSLSCTKGSTRLEDNCNCDSYRILVWEDGADDFGSDIIRVSGSTVAGHYYGGHSPCKLWSLIVNRVEYEMSYCGVWSSSGIVFTHITLLLLIIIKFLIEILKMCLWFSENYFYLQITQMIQTVEGVIFGMDGPFGRY